MVRVLVLGLLVLAAACVSRNAPTETALSFKEKNPHQIVFSHEKIEEIKAQGGLKKIYRLWAGHLPKGQQFQLYGRDFKKEETLLYRFQVDKEGKLTTTDEHGTYTLSDIHFRTEKFRRGEPYHCILISKDGKTKIGTTLIPFPIETTALDKARLTLTLASADATQFVLQGEGFAPKEMLKFHLKIEGKESEIALQADRKGRVTHLLTHAADQKKGGRAFLTLQRKKEAMALDYGWGEDGLRLVSDY